MSRLLGTRASGQRSWLRAFYSVLGLHLTPARTSQGANPVPVLSRWDSEIDQLTAECERLASDSETVVDVLGSDEVERADVSGSSQRSIARARAQHTNWLIGQPIDSERNGMRIAQSYMRI